MINLENLELLGQGRNRRVYRHKNYVIKVPLHDYGLTDNYLENSRYKNYYKNKEKFGEEKYRACRLLANGYLIMEYLEPIEDPYDESVPNWVSFIDCQQVEYNKKGILKAYDYGN